ncbi:MAG: hypothetical protein JWR80_913 [Bradyrhizobium sp.]|nr:hypothetical protein [Bradyrhizobium sp.]
MRMTFPNPPIRAQETRLQALQGSDPFPGRRAFVGLALVVTTLMPCGSPATAQRSDLAARAAVHPVATPDMMNAWLARVPMTRQFPPDFDDTLRGFGSLYVIEMTTAPGCLPCADLWSRIGTLGARYGWQRRTISGQEAVLRSGRLGLPWVGHPVAWVRPVTDPDRMIPIAIGTDHSANLARNLYLAAKMLTGVRPAVAVRAMSKFTGIVGAIRPFADRR